MCMVKETNSHPSLSVVNKTITSFGMNIGTQMFTYVFQAKRKLKYGTSGKCV